MKNEKIIDNRNIYVKFVENIDRDFVQIFTEIEIVKKNPFDKDRLKKIFKYVRFFRGIFEILGFVYLSKVSELYEKTIENFIYNKNSEEENNLWEYIDNGIEKLYKITRIKITENYAIL